MGMLTKIKLRLKIDHKKITQQHIDMLKNIYNAVHPPNLPDHPFFKCERWFLLRPKDIECLHYMYGEKYLYFDCEFKNYDNELDKFLNWIFPVCKHEDHEFLGIYYNDHNDWMTPIYYK